MRVVAQGAGPVGRGGRGGGGHQFGFGQMRMIKDHMIAELGDATHCGDDFESCFNGGATTLHAIDMEADELKELVALPVLKAILPWLAGQRGEQEQITAMLENSKHSTPLQNQLKGLSMFEECSELFQKPLSVEFAGTVKTIFNVGLSCSLKGYATSGFMPFACPHWYLCLEGEVIVYAIDPKDFSEPTHALKLAQQVSMSGDEVKRVLMLHEKNGYVRAKAGKVVYIPAGMMVRIITVSESVFAVKWASWPSESGASTAAVAKRVLSAATVLLASFPALSNANFKCWLEILQDVVQRAAVAKQGA